MKYRCKRCGHKWLGRMLTPPLKCPRCANANWDKSKRRS